MRTFVPKEALATVRRHPILAGVAVGLAIFGLAMPIQADELDTPAWKAASFINGIYTTYVDTLHICQEIDGKNVAAYNDAIRALATVATPALNQADKVMRGEATRARKDADWLAEAKQDIDQIALATADDFRKAPEKLLADCRFAPEQAKSRIGIFAPLRDQFPKQMHIVEQWH
jgi:hypothetical protein